MLRGKTKKYTVKRDYYCKLKKSFHTYTNELKSWLFIRWKFRWGSVVQNEMEIDEKEII